MSTIDQDMEVIDASFASVRVAPPKLYKEAEERAEAVVMETHELVNLVVRKLGGNRVKFNGLTTVCVSSVSFTHGFNDYIAYGKDDGTVNVCRYLPGEIKMQKDAYATWVEGILNGMVRNDAGEMVPR